MTGRELQKLSRRDLLELLVRQQEENEILRTKVEELEIKLNDRAISVEKAGSLAEAALALGNIFAEADKAAGLYLENIRRCSEERQKEYDKIILDANGKAEEILRGAEEEKVRKIAEADKYWTQKGQEVKMHFLEDPDIKQMYAAIKNKK